MPHSPPPLTHCHVGAHDLQLTPAQPQRPRALRVHDENMPPPATHITGMPGKTLHHRTKSTPALSSLLQAGAVKAANKKVLGEVNANVRLLQPAKDDSEVGKASPGKLSIQESVLPVNTAAFSRPATRPLPPKPVAAHNVPTAVQAAVSRPTTTTQMSIGQAEPERKIVTKKSTKVLRDVQAPEASTAHDVQHPVSTLPAHQTTESIPLRDEPAARPQPRTSHPPTNPLPAAFTTEQEYRQYIDLQTARYQQAHDVANTAGVPAPYVLPSQPMDEHYFEVDEVDEYDELNTARSFGLYGDSTGGVTTILGPKYGDQINQELREARDYVEATRPAEDIEDEQWDTSMVAEYGDEIFEYIRELEVRMAPNPRYMEQQTEIQWSMRSVLMDWVIQVHQRFNLLPETLFLTVNYIDRFLSCKIVSLGKLQLVGATAIFVAAKYEEVQCPTISEIIYMVDNGYSADELLKAERFMLSMLQFELGWPGPMSFLRRISKADDYDLETRTLAKYFLEVTIMDERFVGCTPSFLAAGAHCMARLMLYNGEWSKAHVYYSNYTWSQLRQLLAVILECCEDPHRHHSAVYDKYTDKRYRRASPYVEGKLAAGFRLPIDNPAPLTMGGLEYGGML
ncbi:cyclin-like protein [Neohortaea acidophila]|uniref:Cyclin-like protein n=1 Tax=Neohortaea acidophila TaxID=245834 RepID=A0A6A6Q1W6_9PEZI|nr:cyclin-like protein [Neohortaea acidophila]KAF2486265.1 cyclin-like protein [Neohortaea acidophila]